MNSKIKKAGLQLLENETSTLLEKIKHAMVAYVYHSDEKPTISFSDYVSKELNHSYGYLDNFFQRLRQQLLSNISLQ